MDLRTGRLYASVEDARADGVPESDIAHVVNPFSDNPVVDMLKKSPPLEFPKSPFASIRNKVREEVSK